MYDLISQLINHNWITGTNTPGDQTYIMVGCILLICTLLFYFLDLILGFIFKIVNFNKSGK